MTRLAMLGMVCCAMSLADSAAAQGCSPIRFTTPVDLGGQGQAYERAHQWQLTAAYRRLHSNQFFVGSVQSPQLGPGGQPPEHDIHTIIAQIAYSPTERIRLSVSLPFSTGSFSRMGWADSARHQQTATGIGDLGVSGNVWLLNPRSHQNGNLSVGLGIKAPTGSHARPSLFYTATGSVPFPADQTIQPGDGGWAITLEAQAFRRIREGLHLYAFGSYMASPKAESDVSPAPAGPLSTVRWSVPDIYQARFGASLAAWRDQGLTLSLGGRLDGIPKNDLMGGGDTTTLKRTSQILYADPGLSLRRGKSTVTLSVPIRLHVNRFKSGLEARTASGPLSQNGGGYAKYLIFASYTHRL